jgi:hypothetical protein
MLHLLDGQVACKRCGAQLNIPDGRAPDFTFLAQSGEPVVRVVKVDGDEIHRCPALV